MKGNETIMLRNENEDLKKEVIRLKKKVNELVDYRMESWKLTQDIMEKFPGIKERATKMLNKKLVEEGINMSADRVFKLMKEEMDIEARMFPVHSWAQYRREGWDDCPPVVPWAMLKPFETQAVDNHSQTLERLAERGGLCPEEIYAVMNGEKWRSVKKVGVANAIKFINERIEEYRSVN